jgi:hypothetical protein
MTRLVLCGQMAEQRMLYSALDAHVHHLKGRVARVAHGTVAHPHADLAEAALRTMRFNMRADRGPGPTYPHF